MNDKMAIRRPPGGARTKHGPVARTERASDAQGFSPEEERLAMYARALGHPARVAIMRLLISCGECMCGDIVRYLPLAQATVSQHLKTLKEAGLIRGTIDPPRVCYCADPDAVREAQTLLAALTTNVPDVTKIS